MSSYHLPDPGQLDPIESLHHYTGNYLSVLRQRLEDGERPHWTHWNKAREILSRVLGGFADGTYTCQYSQAFTPEVARHLSEEVVNVVRKGALPEELKGLEEKLLRTADEHAIQTGRQGRTSAGIRKLRLELLAERKKGN